MRHRQENKCMFLYLVQRQKVKKIHIHINKNNCSSLHPNTIIHTSIYMFLFQQDKLFQEELVALKRAFCVSFFVALFFLNVFFTLKYFESSWIGGHVELVRISNQASGCDFRHQMFLHCLFTERVRTGYRQNLAHDFL